MDHLSPHAHSNMQEGCNSAAGAGARQALEDQIKVHARAIIDIKTRLNTMTTVARLPPEILSTIFTLLPGNAFEHGFALRHIDTYRTNDWIRVAHVCHHWRATALNTPRLWSYIVVTSKRAVDELLARSKKAPLHIMATVTSYSDDRQVALKDIMSELARIRALKLTGDSRAICELLQTTSAPATMLESIRLAERDTYVRDVKTIPLVLPADSVPRLRDLEISGFQCAWDNPVFCSTLTSLSLCGRAGAGGSFETFLTAIEKMTGLRELKLEHVIPPAPVGPPSRKVPLMRLSSLRVSSGDAECRNLLNHLTLPAGVRFSITITEGVLGTDNLFHALQNHVTSSSPLRTASIEGAWTGRIAIKSWHTEYAEIPVYDPWEVGLTLYHGDLELETMTGGDCISALLCNSTVFAGITILDIHMAGHILSRWRWLEVFAGMPNIRRLSVFKDQDARFLEALSQTTNSNDPATLALPRLEVLKLEDMRLLSRDHDEPPEFLDLVIDALITRCNCGLPLQELHIKRCLNIYSGDVTKVEQIVPKLVWDGVEESEESEEEEDEDDDDYDYGYGDGIYDDELDDYELDAADLWGDEDVYFGLY